MESKLDDSKIIELFYERSGQAIIELSNKYDNESYILKNKSDFLRLDTFKNLSANKVCK